MVYFVDVLNWDAAMEQQISWWPSSYFGFVEDRALKMVMERKKILAIRRN